MTQESKLALILFIVSILFGLLSLYLFKLAYGYQGKGDENIQARENIKGQLYNSGFIFVALSISSIVLSLYLFFAFNK